MVFLEADPFSCLVYFFFSYTKATILKSGVHRRVVLVDQKKNGGERVGFLLPVSVYLHGQGEWDGEFLLVKLVPYSVLLQVIWSQAIGDLVALAGQKLSSVVSSGCISGGYFCNACACSSANGRSLTPTQIRVLYEFPSINKCQHDRFTPRSRPCCWVLIPESEVG